MTPGPLNNRRPPILENARPPDFRTRRPSSSSLTVLKKFVATKVLMRPTCPSSTSGVATIMIRNRGRPALRSGPSRRSNARRAQLRRAESQRFRPGQRVGEVDIDVDEANVRLRLLVAAALGPQSGAH